MLRAAAQPLSRARASRSRWRKNSASTDRGRFYDRTGAIRDVLQNHMLQIAASVMADPPEGRAWVPGDDSKSQFIASLRPLTPEDTVRGQYDGYLDVAGVAPGSTTESYVAVRLGADSWRWSGVPIVIRAGKCMPVTATEVYIRFRHPPHDPFGLEPSATTNALRFRVYPEGSGRPDPDREEARRRLGDAAGGAHFRRAAGLGHADIRPADRRRAGRQSLAVRAPGHDRSRLGCRRPSARQCSSAAQLRQGQLGTRRRPTACCRKAFPGTTRPSTTTSRTGARNERSGHARTGGDHRRRIRRAVRGAGTAQWSVLGHAHRPHCSARIPAAPVPVRDGHPV